MVLQALDRVAKTQEPDTLSVYCATHSWWLLRRLRSLGFEIIWPIWVMSSVPLPGAGPLPAHAPGSRALIPRLESWPKPHPP